MKKLIIPISLLLVSCKSAKTVYVPVESVKTEYVNSTDSIYLHDSVYFEVQTKNDTVYSTKYKYKVLEKFSTDTVIKVDSIPVIKTVEKVVETNKLHWWQKALMYTGIASLLSVAGIIYKKVKL